VHLVDVPFPAESEGTARADGDEITFAERMAGGRIVVETRDLGAPCIVAVATWVDRDSNEVLRSSREV